MRVSHRIHGAIGTPRGEQLAVRPKGQLRDAIARAGIRPQHSTGDRVPQLDLTSPVTARSQHLAIGAESDRPRSLCRGLPLARSQRQTLLSIPDLLLLTGTYAVVGYYEYALFYWMKYYFSDVLGYPEQTSRWFTSIVSLAMVVAMPLGGILSDWPVRLPRLPGRAVGRTPIRDACRSAVLLFAATSVRGQVPAVTLFFLAHAAIGLCEAPTWVAGLEIGGKSCGTSAAIVNTGGNLGDMLAPIVTAYVALKLGWQTSFLIPSLACLLGAALWLTIRLKHPAGGASDRPAPPPATQAS